jgi:hypothetical protein
LHEQIALSRSDERVWDRLTDAAVQLEHPRPFGPSRKASTMCESGGRDYCVAYGSLCFDKTVDFC